MISSGFQTFLFPDFTPDEYVLKLTIDKIISRSSSGLISFFSLSGRISKGLETTKCTHFNLLANT